MGKIFLIIALSIAIFNAFALYCCCKAAGRADRMAEKMREQKKL